MSRHNTVRVVFTQQHDTYLYKYLAKYCPGKEGRSGIKVYQKLAANGRNLWPWHVHHTWQSWRERYVRNQATFDGWIRSYQEKHGVDPVGTVGKKRAADPTPIEMLGQSPKRIKLQAEEDVTRETHAERHASPQQTSSESKQASRLVSKQPLRKSPVMDSRPSASPRTDPDAIKKPGLDVAQAPHDVFEIPSSLPEEAQPSTPPRANTDATERPTLDLPAFQTRHDTLEITSSPEKPAPVSTDTRPEPHAAKRIKKRPRTPSDLFISDAESETGKDATVPSRAPPRLVNSFQGQVLVDQKGRVPHVILLGKAEEEEEEEEEEVEAQVEDKEDKEKWPPVRGATARQTKANGPDAEVETHHAFSQPQPPSRPEVPQETMTMDGRERGKPRHPPRHADSALFFRRSVIAQFLGQRPGVAPQVESEQRENGSSPIKPIVPTAGPPIPKAFKFPAPRASTRSPFRPEPSSDETLHPPRPSSRTRAARHPALARVRRQTIGHGNENGHKDEERRERAQVPSIDFVALSRASTSSRSHSRSSAGTSVPARPPRWSLPAFANTTPWVLNETEGAHLAPESVMRSSSRSPFRWSAPSPVYGDIWGRRMQAASPVGVPAPRFMLTPSPERSVTAVATSTNTDGAPRPDAMAVPASSSSALTVVPHPADVELAASHGLASILAHMSANHGLAMGVVEAVYARVGTLREADEVLKGMREAAEGFGEQEIERRVRRRRKERWSRCERGKREELRYVVASEDGEGSEYLPPETSRAAMWKRQSELAKSGEEESRDEEKDEDGLRAQELEKNMGKGRYRRDIVRRFI